MWISRGITRNVFFQNTKWFHLLNDRYLLTSLTMLFVGQNTERADGQRERNKTSHYLLKRNQRQQSPRQHMWRNREERAQVSHFISGFKHFLISALLCDWCLIDAEAIRLKTSQPQSRFVDKALISILIIQLGAFCFCDLLPGELWWCEIKLTWINTEALPWLEISMWYKTHTSYCRETFFSVRGGNLYS